MSITQTKENICQGAVTTISLGAADLGPTSEAGVTLSDNKTFYDHKNDQTKGVIKKTLIDRKVFVDFELTEAGLANLHKALNEASASLSGSSLTIDTTQADDAEFQAVGTAPGGNNRTLILDAVQIVSNVSHKMSKNEPAMMAIQVEALYDTSASRFGTIGDAA